MDMTVCCKCNCVCYIEDVSTYCNKCDVLKKAQEQSIYAQVAVDEAWERNRGVGGY